jgi:hypothetical protein
VFGRYVLPLMPILCLLSAAAVFALLGRGAPNRRAVRPPAQRALLGVAYWRFSPVPLPRACGGWIS